MPWNFPARGVIGSAIVPSGPSYQVARSIRYNSPDSACFTKPAGVAPTSTRKFTISVWLKRAKLSGANFVIFSAGTSHIQFDTADKLYVYEYNGGIVWSSITTAVYRDPGAWMHMVWAFDTTAGTGLRSRLWINGVPITLTGEPALNYDFLHFNGVVSHAIGRYQDIAGGYFDGYMAEYYDIDGQSLDASNFGQTNSTTGQWEPIAYAGTFGKNGFYLNFSDNSNTTPTTLGKDSAPIDGVHTAANNWTPNAFSVAAGSGNDSLVDTPTNYGTDTGVGGEVRGNYATLNPLDNTLTLSDGNIRAQGASVGAWSCARTAFAVPSAQHWWMEAVVPSSGATNDIAIGISDIGQARPTFPGNGTLTVGYLSDGTRWVNGASTPSWGAAYGLNDRVGVRIDSGSIYFYKQTGGAGAWALQGGGAAATGFTGEIAFCQGFFNQQVTTPNFGQRPWSTTLPAAGAKAWCTQNLPDPAIAIPAKYFDINTWTGTAGARTLVNDAVFQPDLLWAKSRSSANNHGLTDAVRGVTKILESNSTIFDRTLSDEVLSFNTTGFSLGGSANSYTNANGPTYVGWQWKQGITPGLFIGAFTSTSGTQAVPHGLGVTPKFVLVKNRTGSSAGNWHVWHSALANPSTSYLILNSSSAALTFSTMWGPSGHDSINLNFTVSGSIFPGDTNITYAFAEVPGFSRFGSYTGNSNVDGPFVWCGFRPKFILWKTASLTEDWYIRDTTREPSNPSTASLKPNLTAAEAGTNQFDFLSNGFKPRHTGSGNVSGSTVIFAAFAEAPFKYARAEKSPTPTGVASNPPATSFQVLAPATAVNGVAFSFSVQARAAGANTTNYTGTIHFTSTSGGATLPADATLVSGVGTFSATFPASGTFTITVTDTVTGSINGTSGNIVSAAVTPGSQTITTVGANSFTVPAFNTLSIEVFGAGGGGGGAGGGSGAGSSGGASSYSTLVAGGGTGGGGTAGAASSGGVASGGDTNTNGSAGNGNPSNTGGAAANGGPGTGGNSAATGGGFGGGGGSYAKKTYTPAALTIGGNISIAVGGGGGGGAGSVPGTAGGNGKAIVTWS